MPGDVVLLEAGDVVPADGRILTSASLEVQEASLTGESAPVTKDRTTLPEGEVALGDRTNLVFQNTQITRGTATFVVTATGQATQMGQIADMVTATKRTRSPLQRELDGMTKVFGLVAWLAVAVIAIFGIVRGQEIETLLLLCVSTAIASIPTGLPTFVQAMLSSGARRLAESKAVVKSLTDVETLGGTTVINSDKTGTLTMNAMTSTTMLAGGDWYTIEGAGYRKTGAILGVAGAKLPDFSRLALGLSLCTDATVADDETVIGDPTEAAFVVLAAKMGTDAAQTREALPRRAEVPFDSEYKFMATFHDRPDWMTGGILHEPHFACVKGAPDVVVQRCSQALWHGELVPIDAVRDEILAANRQLSERGLRVLAFAARDLDDAAMSAALADPMAAVTDLVLVALVGIMDPLRTEAKDAVHVALKAGIDVRMITGDHTVTARAIADELGLGPGVITGTELSHLTDAEVIGQLPELHVFGRVAPEDKLRLARVMQESGEVVAMTGDAVNDAAALKQADIGVAMGSGSEVTKQAAKIVLTDDNFATLVRAVDLGRDIYRRITSYVKLQLTILSSVLQLMVFATILNINGGVALFPLQLLFCKFFVVITVVIGFIVDVPDPGVMQRPPRKPGTKIVNPPQIVRWVVTGFIVAATALAVLAWGPDEPSTDAAVRRHDHGLRHRLAQRGQHRPGDAARAAGAVVVAGLPVPGLDHPRLDPHLGRRGAEHAAAPARHDLAHRRAMAGRARPVPHRAGGRRGRQGHPALAPSRSPSRAEPGGDDPAGNPDQRLTTPSSAGPDHAGSAGRSGLAVDRDVVLAARPERLPLPGRVPVLEVQAHRSGQLVDLLGPSIVHAERLELHARRWSKVIVCRTNVCAARSYWCSRIVTESSVTDRTWTCCSSRSKSAGSGTNASIDERTARCQGPGDVAETVLLPARTGQVEQRVEDQVDQRVRAGHAHVGHVADDDRDRVTARLGAQQGHHLRRRLDAFDRDAALGQRKRHPAAADGQLQDRAAGRQASQELHRGRGVGVAGTVVRRRPLPAEEPRVVEDRHLPQQQKSAAGNAFKTARGSGAGPFGPVPDRGEVSSVRTGLP